MIDIQDLYQELIIDHGTNPRNCCKLDKANHEAKGYNPLCGDEIKIYLEIVDDKIINVSFEGNGCAISQASASLMTEAIKNKTIEEAKDIFKKFQESLTVADAPKLELGKLQVFSGVKQFPSRVKCATLSWHTFCSALSNKGKTVSTENNNE